MQLLKGLYQVGGDMNGITWAGVDAGFEDGNSFILDTGEGLILFDCGCGDTFPQILDNLRYWDLAPESIKACLITHPHFDHAGGAYLVKERGIPIYAHEYTAASMAAGDERCCGYLYHKSFTPCTVDETLQDAQRLRLLGVDIEVLHLPGHTLGCTAFLFELAGKRVLVCGDVIGTLNVGHFGWSGSIDFDRRVYLESLKRLARLDTDVMLSGHGASYFHKPRRRVESVLNEALIAWR